MNTFTVINLCHACIHLFYTTTTITTLPETIHPQPTRGGMAAFCNLQLLWVCVFCCTEEDLPQYLVQLLCIILCVGEHLYRKFGNTVVYVEVIKWLLHTKLSLITNNNYSDNLTIMSLFDIIKYNSIQVKYNNENLFL